MINTFNVLFKKSFSILWPQRYCCAVFFGALWFVLDVINRSLLLLEFLRLIFFFSFFLFFFFVALGFEHGASYLLGRYSYCLSYSVSPWGRILKLIFLYINVRFAILKIVWFPQLRPISFSLSQSLSVSFYPYLSVSIYMFLSPDLLTVEFWDGSDH
jgi:hypothetical protein